MVEESHHLKPSIFLSASVPDPKREETRGEVPERDRITNAVLALVCVCQRFGLRLCFGGHPAISPMVLHAATAYGLSHDDISIYQSAHFASEFTEAALQFPCRIVTPKADSLEESLRVMREAMLDPDKWRHLATVCVGGMKGVTVEARMFAVRYPEQPIIALTKTGGLTRKLRENLPDRADNLWIIPEQREAKINSLPEYESLLRDLIKPLVEGATNPAAEVRPVGLGRAPKRTTRRIAVSRAMTPRPTTAALGSERPSLDPDRPLSLTPNGQTLQVRFPATEYTPEHFPAGVLLIEATTGQPPDQTVVSRRLMAIQPCPREGAPLEFSGEINLDRWKTSRHDPLPQDFNGEYVACFITADTPKLRALIKPEELQRYKETLVLNESLRKALGRLISHLESEGS